MRCKTLISAGVACLALAGPAAAQEGPGYTALYPEVVPGAGLSGVAGAEATIHRTIRGGGSTATARFTVRTNRLVFVDLRRNIRFRALKIGSVSFGLNDATLKGVGLKNGKRVAFTAVGIHNATPGVDVLRISFGRGPSLGGRVLEGQVFIR